MKLRIIPYAKSSMGAKDIANRLTEILGDKVWRGPPLKGRMNLSWGYKGPAVSINWINHPDKVKNATDKRKAFAAWDAAGVSHVPWTTDKKVAEKWAKETRVIARTACQQAASGITVVEPEGVVPTAELYTKYIPKKQEFRVHVFNGKAILVQEKRRKKGFPNVDSVIRANHRGWVFCVKNVNEPAGLRDLGVAAVGALGLDFGAVDIIFNHKLNQLFCLEVNSAPGLCTPTLEAYSNAIAARMATA